jgi:phage tail-like protein
MASTQRTDPLRNFKFRVSIIPKSSTGNLATSLSGIGDLGFAQVSGISVTNEVISYREGGMNTHPHKMVGQSDFAPVSFARGAFNATGTNKQDALWNWQKFMHAWVGGGISGGANLADGSGDYRCDVIVKVYDHPNNAAGVRYQYDGELAGAGTEIKPGNCKFQFKLHNCWPGAYALTDLNAGDNGIMIQSMTLHHEGFYIDWTGTDDLAAMS